MQYFVVRLFAGALSRFSAPFLLLLLCVPVAAQSSDWPQWRGADGMAVSEDAPLPSRIGAESEELVWKVPVEGHGVSSPIVSGDRVFVTTAVRDEGSAPAQALGIVFEVASIAAALLALLWLALVRKNVEAGGTAFASWLRRVDRIAIGLGTLAAAALTWYVVLSRGLPGQVSPGRTWLLAGALGLTCAAVAVGWFRASSALRWIGALGLLGLAVPIFALVPLNDYGSPFRLRMRAVMIAPAVAGAAWHWVVFRLSRRATGGRMIVLSSLGASALIATGGAFFFQLNGWRSSTGLLRAVVCFDLETGRELWNTALFSAPGEKKYRENSWATPTPCADGELVFADFGSGYACLDYEGEIQWLERFEGFEELTRYGASTSPILFEDTVIVLHEKELDLGPSYIMALEMATGDVRWRVEPPEHHDNYMTPLLMRRGESFELVTVTTGELITYDPRDGRALWSMPLPIEQMVPSLQYRGDLLLVSGGLVDKASTQAIRLTGTGEDTTPERVWSSRRGAPSISSPVWVGDLFFAVSDAGVMTCWDAESGDTHWRERLERPFFSSLVAGDGKLYAFNDTGHSYVIAAAPDFEVLFEGDFEEACQATPAIADGLLIVRTASQLYAFRQ